MAKTKKKPANRLEEVNGQVTAVLADPIEADECESIIIPAKRKKTIQVTVEGTAPLLVARFSARTLDAIAETMSAPEGEPVKELPPLDLQKQCDAFRFRDKVAGWDGISVLGFKAALVQTCAKMPKINMVVARTLFRVHAEGEDIDGSPIARIITPHNGEPDYKPATFKNWVRVGIPPRTVVMPRWRPIYPVGWRVRLTITFNAARINAQAVVNLLNHSGEGGVGDWRPSSPKNMTGAFGTFDVVSD